MKHKRIFKNGLSQATEYHFASDEVLATSSLIPFDSKHIKKLPPYGQWVFDKSL